MCLVIGMHMGHIENQKMSMHMSKGSFMFFRNQNLFFWLNVLSSSKKRRLLNQGWPLIDFNDTKTLFICLLIKLLSVFRNVFNAKAKEMNPDKQNGKMQNLKVAFKSPNGWIRIPILKSWRTWIQKSGFESQF